ncbi:DNA polymerase III subunit alpha [Sulfuriroseicoccus oceanibius]|uniref:DNA polymerase III subunit alpha n=1 Tax=Sulfuriroseicoccus oceanibius TaxID=2707525 RepID=A0A6B3L280_9BACT|nr:DNA polymerase III subunit alpha [Sulfuriroseicoccus oceanibius]QQL45608.1 DNA polymerase III subunit alpha [Sulfuriroseicoccus oceanibius]
MAESGADETTQTTTKPANRDGDFVHLHLHTEYSTLDGAVRIGDLVERAAKLGMPAVAMTDHGNLFGAVNFFLKAKKAGIKPIFGCEMYLAPGSMHDKKRLPGQKIASHLTLLVENETGYQNLTKLVSMAHLDGFYYKPRIDKDALRKYSEGLICLSGCIVGEINQHIQDDQLDLARQSIRDFIDIFGKENFFLEMHNHGMEAQIKCNAQLVEFAKEFGLRTVAANDVHFLDRSDHEAHDVMICIGTGARVIDENRMHYSEEVYFKTGAEMRELFADHPEACDVTLEIAERCNYEMHLDSASIAKYPVVESPDGGDRNQYFRKLCHEGLVWRYGEERATTDQELIERLDYEIGVMEKMGFVSYFLIVRDFMDWSRRQDIPLGPGRGSAAGSLVAYALGITDLCPIRFGLIFERFLNPERNSPPDVDIDFCQTRRPEVIQYVREKYGERAVSHIITFGTMGAKSVIRDVGRVMGWSFGESDQVAKMIPAELGMTLSKARETNAELAALIENDGRVQELWRHATFLEGLTRGTGIHAAGVVICDTDIDNFVALTRGNEGEVVTQADMGAITEIGLLKMDFLGLKTLTVIQDAVNWVRRHTPDFDINAQPFDDKKTYELLQRGETKAVFQLESGGMAATCVNLGVDRIEDIIALLALYRPGPMDLIPSFIDRKKGIEKVEYMHPLLEEVSEETFGILIYQEQVQKAANLLAGYSLGEADLLRRAMGKKKLSEMVAQRKKFVEGAARVNNIPAKQANDIFDLLEKFAGYGFNKSHSAAYGLISYRTAFLKANYPVEFMSGVMSNEINNTEKISFFVAECMAMNIQILPPDINKSLSKFAPENTTGGPIEDADAIRYGLSAIKNVGEGAVALMIQERDKNGEFKSMEDFASRVDAKAVNRKLLESLVRAGAFDWTGEPRWKLFGKISTVLAGASAVHKDRASGQVSLFDALELSSAAAPPKPADDDQNTEPEWTRKEMLDFERELLGFYVSGHPLDDYRGHFSSGDHSLLGDIDHLVMSDVYRGPWKDRPKGHKDEKHPYSFVAFIQGVMTRFSKNNNKPFAILTVEDYSGSQEVGVFGKTYDRCSELLVAGGVIKIDALVLPDERSGGRKLSVEKVSAVSPREHSYELDGVVTLVVDCRKPLAKELADVKDVVSEYPGRVPLHLLFLQKDGSQIRAEADEKFAVEPSSGFKVAASRWLPRR